VRRIFVFAFALIAALVACIGLLLYRPSLWPEVAARLGASAPEFVPAERADPFATPEIKETTAKLPTPVAPSDTLEQSQVPSPEPSGGASLIYRFPTRADIPVGTTKPDILATFGPPQATVTGADRGQLQERLIYTEPKTGRKTAIAVTDGKVTRAETFIGEKAP
jgi:hypothetical protein